MMPLSQVSNPSDLDQDKLQILLDQVNMLSTKMTSLYKSQESMLSNLETRLTLLASKTHGRPSSLIPNSCSVFFSETTVPSIVKQCPTGATYQLNNPVLSTTTDPLAPTNIPSKDLERCHHDQLMQQGLSVAV